MVTFLSSESGDWIAMYVDGEMKLQGHSLRPEDIVKALGVEVESKELSDERLEELHWSFPEAL